MKTIQIFCQAALSPDKKTLVVDISRLPGDVRECVERFETELALTKGAWQKIAISPPSKPRTTGERSQEAHVRGHCESISVQAKNHRWTPEQVLAVMKGLTALSGRPYPKPEYFRGVPVYASNADLSSIEENSLIETIHQFADEHNFWLTEYTNELEPRPYKTRGGRTLAEMMSIEPELNPEYAGEQQQEQKRKTTKEPDIDDPFVQEWLKDPQGY